MAHIPPPLDIPHSQPPIVLPSSLSPLNPPHSGSSMLSPVSEAALFSSPNNASSSASLPSDQQPASISPPLDHSPPPAGSPNRSARTVRPPALQVVAPSDARRNSTSASPLSANPPHSPSSSRSASPSPKTPTHPHHRPDIHRTSSDIVYPHRNSSDANRANPRSTRDGRHPSASGGKELPSGPTTATSKLKSFFGRSTSTNSRSHNSSRSRDKRQSSNHASNTRAANHSPRLPAMHPNAVSTAHKDLDADLLGEPTLLPSDESVEPEEYSFSSTPHSSSASTTSTSSLPSQSTACGRMARWFILKLRSCVNSKTKRILTASSLVSLCFVIGTIIYIYTALNDINDNYNWVVHTGQVQNDIEQLYWSLLNAESSVRGYVITNETSFLSGYNNSVLDPQSSTLLWPYYYSITNLTTDNPFQQNNLAILYPYIQERLYFLNQTVNAITVNHNFTEAQALVITGSADAMTEIRLILNTMENEENLLLQQRKDSFSHSLNVISIVMFVVLACVAIVIISGLLIGYDWDTRLLKRTNAKLEVLLSKAEEGTKMKSLFLANMSHEIRTPMNGVLAMAHLLSTSTQLTADQHDIVDTIITSADAMMRLINDLLLFSKIEAGKFILTPEWFYLPTFLTPITEMFTVRAHAKDVGYVTIVDKGVPKYLFQDSGRLRQVLVNLCDNAIKFTQHGRVKLHVAFVRRLVPVKGGPITGTVTGGLSGQLKGNKESKSSKEISANSLTPNGTPLAALRSLLPGSGSGPAASPAQPQSTPSNKDGPPSPRPREASFDLNQQAGQQSHSSGSAAHGLVMSNSQHSLSSDGGMFGTPTGATGYTIAAGGIHSSQPLEERFYIIFSVTDTGIGIAPAVQKSIFEPFQQADNSTTREYGGTGLGLSISSQLVRSMGGKLKVRSQLGSGATFEFAVPVTTVQLAKAMEMEAKDQQDDDKEDEDERYGDQAHDAVHTKPAAVKDGTIAKLANDAHPMMGVKSALYSQRATEMQTIQETDKEHRHRHGHHHQRTSLPPLSPADHENSGRSSSANSRSSITQMSASHMMSHSGAVKWHADWFGEEVFDASEKKEQLQLLEAANTLPPLPDHFNSTPPGLHRAICSAPATLDVVTGLPALSLSSDQSASSAFGGSATTSPMGHPMSSTRIITGSSDASVDPEQRTDSHSNSDLEVTPEPPPVPANSSLSSNDKPSTSGTTESSTGSSNESTLSATPISTATTIAQRSVNTERPYVASASPVLASSTLSHPSRSVSDSVSVTSTPVTGTGFSSLGSSAPNTNSNSHSRRRLPPAAVITPQGPRLRILCVEDNPVNQKVAKRLLEKDGHTVLLANHGQEALDMWTSDTQGFDVVLMDLHMPVMDGLTATRSIRQSEAVAAYKTQQANHEHHDSSTTSSTSRPSRIPIIAVTASALEEDANRCMQSGFDDIIHKPIDIHLLSKKMGQLIAMKRDKMERKEKEREASNVEVVVVA